MELKKRYYKYNGVNKHTQRLLSGETEGKKNGTSWSLNFKVNQSAGSKLVTSSIRNHGHLQLITKKHTHTYRHTALLERELSITTEINNSMFSSLTCTHLLWQSLGGHSTIGGQGMTKVWKYLHRQLYWRMQTKVCTDSNKNVQARGSRSVL